VQTYLVELLMKQDQMSMAASIESRVPYLDHEFVEHVAAIPGRNKLHGWHTKAALRAALRDLVPREILTRRKMGFPVPVNRWFRPAKTDCETTDSRRKMGFPVPVNRWLRNRFWPVVREFVLGPRAL